MKHVLSEIKIIERILENEDPKTVGHVRIAQFLAWIKEAAQKDMEESA